MKWALNESIRNDVKIVSSFFIVPYDVITKKINRFIADNQLSKIILEKYCYYLIFCNIRSLAFFMDDFSSKHYVTDYK